MGAGFNLTTKLQKGTGSCSGNVAAILLGVAMGGFLDGILLHQILQWHHLLSALAEGHFKDLRVQILADGLFHMLLYIVLAIGLLLLWQSPKSSRSHITCYFLIGFGIWHILDGLLSHWLFGIHRIRPQSDSPLFWDLLFFIALGVIPVVIGLAFRHHIRPMRPLALFFLMLFVGITAVVSALPLRDTQSVLVVFREDITMPEVITAARSINAGLLWSNRANSVWVFRANSSAEAMKLYRYGALLVGGSFFGIGCFSPTKNL